MFIIVNRVHVRICIVYGTNHPQSGKITISFGETYSFYLFYIQEFHGKYCYDKKVEGIWALISKS